MLSNWDNYPTWSARGSEEAPSRANRIWKDLLANYQQPPLDDAIREELEAFVTRRKSEGGAPTN
jgi:trimethylamine--corrinoid protein Co-methyltransferase